MSYIPTPLPTTLPCTNVAGSTKDVKVESIFASSPEGTKTVADPVSPKLYDFLLLAIMVGVAARNTVPSSLGMASGEGGLQRMSAVVAGSRDSC